MSPLDRRQIAHLRACRDACIAVARSERAQGSREAVALLVRTAWKDHRRLMSLLRAAPPAPRPTQGALL